jgi:lauroyl/myristoyl acyltransferase
VISGKFISWNDLYLLMVLALVNMGRAVRAQSWLASGIGLAAFHLSRAKRRHVEANLVHLFEDDLSATELGMIARDSFCEFWRDIFTLRLNQSDRKALGQIQIQGKEYLVDALSRGRGAIILESSHFGRRNLAKQILHQQGTRVHQVHHEGHIGGLTIGPPTLVQRRFVKPFLEKHEMGFVAEIIYVPDSDSLIYAKQLVSLVQRNEVICISGDGRKGHKRVKLRFLGDEYCFPTGMMNLAKISSAPLLPMFCIVEPNGGTRLVIERPIEIAMGIEREASLREALAQYLRSLESYIMKYPGMYRYWQFERPDN